MGTESSLDIVIKSRFEAAGVQKAIAEMEQQIGKAKATGKAYEDLAKQVAVASKALDAYADEAARAEDALDPGALSFQRGGSGGLGQGEGGGSWMDSMGARAAGAAAAYLSLRTAYRVTKSAIEEYANAQRTLGDLEASLRSRGQDVGNYKDHIVELAEAYERAYNIDAEDWIKAASALTQGGAGSANLDKYMESVKDLASLMEGDVVGAAQAMSRALNGSFEAFSRMGIKMEETWTREQKLEHLRDELHLRGSGLLEQRAKGLSGEWDDMVIKLGNLAKGYGKVIADTGLLSDAMRLVTTVADTFNYNCFEQEKAIKGADSALGDYAKTADQVAVPTKDMAKATKEATEDLQRMTKVAQEAQDALEDVVKEDEARLSHEQKMLNAQEKYDLARIKNAQKAGVLTEGQAAQLEFVTKSQYARRGQAMEQQGYNREISMNQGEIARMNADLRTMSKGLNPEQYERVSGVIAQRQKILFDRNRDLKMRSGFSASEFGAEMQAETAQAGDVAAQAMGRVKGAFVTFAAGINGRMDDLTRTILEMNRRGGNGRNR